MGKNQKKADIHFDFGNVSNIHSEVIFSCRGYKNRLVCQISGHLVPFFVILGLFEVEKGQNMWFFHIIFELGLLYNDKRYWKTGFGS